MANTTHTIKFTGQFDTSQIAKGLQDIKKQISSTHIADDLKKQLESAFNKLEIDIPALEKLTNKEDFNLKEIQALQKLIKELEKDYNNFNKIASEVDFTKSFSSIDLKKLENFKTQIQGIEKALSEAKQEMINTFTKDKNISGSKNITNTLLELFSVKPDEVNNKFQEISKQINDGLEKTGTELRQKLDTLPILKQGKDVIKAFFGEESNVTFAKNQTEAVRKSINDIIREYRRLRELGDENGMLDQVKELQKILSDPKNFNIPEGESPLGLPTEKDRQSLEIIKNNLQEIIDISKSKQDFINENEKELLETTNKEMQTRTEIMESQAQLAPNLAKENSKFNNSLQETKQKASEAETELQRLQRQGEALEQTFGSLARRIENSVSALAVFNKSTQIIRQAIKSVEDLDAAFTQIAIVSEQSTEEAWQMFESFNKLAKQYSITTKDLAEGAKLFYQQGLNAADTMKMVEASTVSAALGEVTMTEAANTLTAAIQGYNESAAVAMDYTDKIAMVGAVSAADFNELSTAMEKTASSAYTAGIDFDHLLGYLGKMIEVTREAPANLGTAMKTIIARFEDMKKDPLAVLEDGVSANKVEEALATIGIALRDSEGEFRALQDVMDELGIKWETLTRNQQAYIATVAAGSRQQSRFLAMMNDYDRTLDLIAESQNSAGAAAQQYAIYQDSVAAAQARLTASWENFYSKIVDNDLIKTAINGTANLIDALSEIPPIITAIGASLGALELQNVFKIIRGNESSITKLVSGFKDLYEASRSNAGNFKELMQISPKLTDVFKSLKIGAEGIGSTIIGTTKAIGAFVAANGWWFFGGIAIAGIIALITSRLTAQKRQYQENIKEIKNFQEEISNLKTNVDNGEELLDTYDNLSNKISLTDEEQTELNNTIKQISAIYPEAITYMDEYGNMQLTNAAQIREVLQAEKDLYNERNRQVIEAKHNLVIKPSKQWKKEDFDAIGFNTTLTGAYFSNQEQINYLKDNPITRYNITSQDIKNYRKDTEAFLEPLIDSLNYTNQEFKLGLNRLAKDASDETILAYIEAINNADTDKLINTLEEKNKLIRETLIKGLDIDSAFLDLNYSSNKNISNAQKIIAAQMKNLFSNMDIDIWSELFGEDLDPSNTLKEGLQKVLDKVSEENSLDLTQLFKDLNSGSKTFEEFSNEFIKIAGITGEDAAIEFLKNFNEQLKKQLDNEKEKYREYLISLGVSEVMANVYSSKLELGEGQQRQNYIEEYGLGTLKKRSDFFKISKEALDDLEKSTAQAIENGDLDGLKSLPDTWAEKWEIMDNVAADIISYGATADAIEKMIEERANAAFENIGKTIDSIFALEGKSSITAAESMDYISVFGSADNFLKHSTINKKGEFELDTYGKMLVLQKDFNDEMEIYDGYIADIENLGEEINDEEKQKLEYYKKLKIQAKDQFNIISKIFDTSKEIKGSAEDIKRIVNEIELPSEFGGKIATENARALKTSIDIGKEYESIVGLSKQLEKQMIDIGQVDDDIVKELLSYGDTFQEFFIIDEADNSIKMALDGVVEDYGKAAQSIIDIADKRRRAELEIRKQEMLDEAEVAGKKAEAYDEMARLLENYVHTVIENEQDLGEKEVEQAKVNIANKIKEQETSLANIENSYNAIQTAAQDMYNNLAMYDIEYWKNLGSEDIATEMQKAYNRSKAIAASANLKPLELIEGGDKEEILNAAKTYRQAADGLRSYADRLRKGSENLKIIDPTVYQELADKMEEASKAGEKAGKDMAKAMADAADSIIKLNNLIKELEQNLNAIKPNYNPFLNLFEAWEKEWDYYYNIKRLISELGQQGQFIDNIISADFVSADKKVSSYHAKIGNLIAQMSANDAYITSLRTGMSQTALELMKDYGEYYKINPDTGQIYQTDRSLNEINTTINAAKEEFYNLSKVQNTRQNDLNLENSKLEALEQEKSAYESILSEVESQIDSYKNLDDIIVDTSELEANRSAIKAKIEISDESIEAQKEKIREMEDEIQNFEIEIELKGNVESKLEEYVDKMEEKVQEYEEYWDTLNSTIEQQQEILSQLNDVFKYYIDTAISTEQEIYNAIVENYQDEINKKKQQYDYLKQLDKDYLASVRENINRERQAREDANKQKSYQQSLQRMQLLQQDTSGAYRNELAQLGKEVEDKRQELYDDLVDKQVEALEKEIDKRHELYDKEVAALEERLAYMQENAILLWETVNSIVAEGAEAMMSQLETTTNYINSNELSKEKQRRQWEQNIKITYDGVTNNQIDNIKAMVEKGKDYINSLQEIRSAMETNINTYQNSTQILIENNANFQSVMDAFMSEWNRITNRFTSYYESWEQTVEILKAALDNNIQALINMNNEGGSIKELDRTLRDSAKDMYDDFISERERYRSELEGLINQIRTEISAAIKDAANAIRGAATGTGVNPNSDTNSNNGSNNTNFVNNPNGNNINGQGNEPKFKLNVWGPDGTSHLSSETKTSSEWQQWIQSARAANGEKSLAGIPWPYKQWRGSEYYRMYKQGGLADYTGLAWLDGTSSNPERILSPRQTKLFESMVHSLEKSTNSNINSGLGSSYNIGDINTTIQVDRLDNETDVNKLVKQVEDKILKTIRNRVVVSV